MKSRRSPSSRQGFSIIELVTVLGVMGIIGLIALVNLGGRRRTVEISTTTQRMAALVREAQSRSMAQASSSSWGVHFDNRGTTPFYSLFSGSYSTSSRENVYALPSTITYTSSTVATGTYAEVTFAQISGLPSGSSSIGIYVTAVPSVSSTLTVASSGAVLY